MRPALIFDRGNNSIVWVFETHTVRNKELAIILNPKDPFRTFSICCNRVTNYTYGI